MGNQSSSSSTDPTYSASASTPPRLTTADPSQFPPGSDQAQIATYLQYAAQNYDSNPTDSLLALLQAVKAIQAPGSAEAIMARVRDELGEDIANHVLDREARLQRAQAVTQQVVDDTSTLLHQQGNSHLLQQAMEDGSSVVCTRCQSMISATRWKPHQELWCPAIQEQQSDAEHENNNDENGIDKNQENGRENDKNYKSLSDAIRQAAE